MNRDGGRVTYSGTCSWGREKIMKGVLKCSWNRINGDRKAKLVFLA